VTTLRAVALAIGPQAVCVAALSRRTYSTELDRFCEKVLKAPDVLRPLGRPAGQPLPGGASWGMALARMGLADEDTVRRGLAFWRQTIVDEDISVLVADSAPLAIHAARGLRDEGWAIRIISIGSPYFLPPADLERFPPLHDDLPVLVEDEQAALAVLNRVAAETDIAPLRRLPALYDVDLALVTGFAFLDPYRGIRPDADRIAPLAPAPRRSAGAGSEIFVYFSAGELRDEALVAALEALPFPRRGFVPSASAAVKSRLEASGMILLNHPASPAEIAEQSRLIVHAAPHGTVCLAALAGLSQFGVPQHLEQLFNAKRCEATGILAHALPGGTDLGDRIAAAYDDRAMADRAREVAVDLRRSHPADPVAVLAERLAPELAAARAALR
jgi:hypothetical protein